VTRLHELADLDQVIWLDYIRRSFITSGDLQALIDDGLRGITSNPAVFEQAIAGSTDYDDDLHRLVDEGRAVEEIYEALILDDIARAADLMRPVYDRTDGVDGYVSLEVDPNLAHDTDGTVAEARRLFAALGRPNVMIKVPATPAGIPAVETLIGEGVNVNVTLIFSVDQYEAAVEAYIAGLERLAATGSGPSKVASVASFFVSRVDTAVDRELEKTQYPSLLGKTAIANSKVAYARFREIVSGERWERLASQGARVQRVLWASTGTKNPTYPDTLYVDSLIGPDTVNTVPPATLNAFRDHGTVALTLEAGLDDACFQLGRLADLGIDLDAVTRKLLDEGVEKFAESFASLTATIAEKCDRLLAGWQHRSASLGAYQVAVDDALVAMGENQVMARIWAHDYTVWEPEPEEIANRLGWLHIAEAMVENAPRLKALAAGAHKAGYTHALLLGMGGSSLAPQVFRETFDAREGDHKDRPYLDLTVLDSTDPGAVLAHAERLDLARTLFIVSTKSGDTAETLSFFKYFYNRITDVPRADRAGDHFVAITDAGTHLADLAARHDFRALFLNDPNLGGRYSALSYFGLVPAALVGVDVNRLLDQAMATACGSEPCISTADNPAAWLGAILGKLAKVGRDKVTFVVSPAIEGFSDWVEQLIAESTGKEGQGILPVVGEPLGEPAVYGDDRLFVHIRLEGDETHDAAVAALEAAGHPVVRLNLRNIYNLGGQFFLWELATAVTGHLLGINPFDQPNVESAKAQARRMIAEYQEKGALPRVESAPLTGEALGEFLAQARPGDPSTGSGRSYVALQAYVQPTPETSAALTTLRVRLRDRYRLATTVGYGPRFLHSTGQLHKGDAGNGLFIQFTADNLRDAPIPDEAGSPESSITFGTLIAAQAMGDRQALLDAGRRVIRFRLGEDVVGGLKKLNKAL
jgi:transaldolase/glucose-6-phosphate isomerase